MPEIARGRAREKERGRERELLWKRTRGTAPRVIVRHIGVAIIKGKRWGRDSSVTSRGGRNFSPPPAVRGQQPGRGCHYARRVCRAAFIMLATRDALMPSETDAPARLQSLTRMRAAHLHPQLVHHAYRCIALKAKFTLLNCATASVKRAAGLRHLFVYLVAKSINASSQSCRYTFPLSYSVLNLFHGA